MTIHKDAQSFTDSAKAVRSDVGEDGASAAASGSPPPFAVYARSALHADGSCERQVAKARAYAASLGGEIVQAYVDDGVGGHGCQRPGLQGLLAGAAEGRFEFVIVQDVDRLSRSQAERIAIFRRLEALDVVVIESDHGPLDLMAVLVLGYMGAAWRTRAALRARLAAGKRAAASRGRLMCACPYGYRLDGEGGHVVDPASGDAVRFVFDSLARGLDCGCVAKALTTKAVPSPAALRAGRFASAPATVWTASAVRKIATNPLYAGTLVWGRTSTKRDPQTGMAVRASLPPDEWIVSSRPDLAIVPHELFARVGELLRRRKKAR